jgi:hypothetical protein
VLSITGNIHVYDDSVCSEPYLQVHEESRSIIDTCVALFRALLGFAILLYPGRAGLGWACFDSEFYILEILLPGCSRVAPGPKP